MSLRPQKMVQARAGLRHTVIHTDINPYKIKKISASWDFRYLVYSCQCSVVVELSFDFNFFCLSCSPKQRQKDLKKGSNGQRTPSSDLIQLYKRLVALKDSTLLQKIADILEKTGHFVLTETTLDFDLCSLDKTTIKKIENSITR